MISWQSIHFSMMTNWMNEYVQLSMTYLMHKLIDRPMHIHKWWRVLPSGGTKQNCTMFLPVICGWCVDSWTWAKTCKKAKTMALRWNLFWKPLVRRIVRCLFQVPASFNVSSLRYECQNISGGQTRLTDTNVDFRDFRKKKKPKECGNTRCWNLEHITSMYKEFTSETCSQFHPLEAEKPIFSPRVEMLLPEKPFRQREGHFVLPLIVAGVSAFNNTAIAYLYCTRIELKLITNYNVSTAMMHGPLSALRDTLG